VLFVIASKLLEACGEAATPEPTEPVAVEEEPLGPPEPTASTAPEPCDRRDNLHNRSYGMPGWRRDVGVHDWSSADRQQYWDDVIAAFSDAHECIVAESVKLPGTVPCA
jgi:hypothetical protein